MPTRSPASGNGSRPCPAPRSCSSPTTTPCTASADRWIPMRVRELSVFLPCYEEEGNVGRTVERAVAVLRERDLERFEIIVVNDGSRDRTGAIADALAAEYDEVRVAH